MNSAMNYGLMMKLVSSTLSPVQPAQVTAAETVILVKGYDFLIIGNIIIILHVAE